MDEFLLFFFPDGSSPIYRTPTVLFQNDGAGFFSRMTLPGYSAPDDSRALVAFDYDRDGDEDLLVTNVDQPARLTASSAKITAPRASAWLT